MLLLFFQHFRELQSLLQQFIIVEHAVEPVVADPSGVSAAGVVGVTDETGAALVDQQGAVMAVAEAEMMEGMPTEEGAMVVDPSAAGSAELDLASLEGSEQPDQSGGAVESISIEPMDTGNVGEEMGAQQEPMPGDDSASEAVTAAGVEMQ